jgi:hypothetical protein
MFGRRGAFLVKVFTTLLLVAVGIFGFDSEGIFLFYALYTAIWQRELEAPAQDEVTELDFGRGCAGIVTALFVFLTLLPHT